MARLVIMFVCAITIALGGCSRDAELQCEDASHYSSSTSVPPIRVPDDLTVPDESDSLLIPDPVPSEAVPPTECLETPPEYFEGQEREGR